MTVDLWYGSKPDNLAEQEVLIELYQYLSAQTEHFVMLVNFYTGHKGNEVDLVIIKENGVFLAELKHVWHPITGSKEGTWKIIKPNGNELVLNKGRHNPFKQTQANYHHWKDWCEDNKEAISAGVVRREPPDFSRVMTYLVCYPTMPEGSNITIGKFPVQAVGFPKFRDSVVIRTNNKVQLYRQEMNRIPQLLKLEQWDIGPPPETTRLENWQPRAFAVLVCRGHQLSVPVFKVDDTNKETITIGRAPENDLVINHPAVSAQHAVIEQMQGRYVVKDLGSTSGTYISFNGDITNEIDITGRINAIKNNSVIRFGPAGYTFLLHQ